MHSKYPKIPMKICQSEKSASQRRHEIPSSPGIDLKMHRDISLIEKIDSIAITLIAMANSPAYFQKSSFFRSISHANAVSPSNGKLHCVL